MSVKLKQILHIELINIEDNILIVEGFVSNPKKDDSLIFSLKSAIIRAEFFERDTRTTIKKAQEAVTACGFKVSINIQNYTGPISAYMSSKEEDRLVMLTHRNAHLDSVKMAYRVVGNHIIYRNRGGLLTISRYNKLDHITRELLYWPFLLKQLRLQRWKEEIEYVRSVGISTYIRMKRLKGALKMLVLPLYSVFIVLGLLVFRILYFVMKLFVKKKIWIISDRPSSGGDNGEAFLKYAVKQNNPHIRIYFLLLNDSKDYGRIKNICPRVISPRSIRYRFLLLLADKVISSQANDIVYNAFGKRSANMTDLYTYDFIFLQHGIIKDDLSRWLNRYNKDLQMFVTSTKPEYKSILEGNYFYDKKIVRLTGLPRYDYLDNKPQGKIILAPTWREDLVPVPDRVTGIRPHDDEFIHSDYYLFYNTLMNDERLLKTLREHNMSGELYLHPMMASQVEDFKSNNHFYVKDMPYDYATAFSEGNILVTDYSSVVFDFAYMKKPVIYSQFDADTFYDGHTYDQGYFLYERDGLGPVVYNLDSTVDELIRLIKNGCVMDSVYLSRTKKFFYKFDKNNSARVYDDIVSLNRRLR